MRPNHRDQARVLFAEIEREMQARAACSLHVFQRAGLLRFRCRGCGWEARPTEVIIYEQGLRHGRAREGGGRLQGER